MPYETTTATDAWAVFSARPAGHLIGGVLTVEPSSPARLISIVAPPAFPGLALAIPTQVANQIDALTRCAIAALMDPNDLAAETTFGPDAGRMVDAGLPKPLAVSVARWGSGLYHFATRLRKVRDAVAWNEGRQARADKLKAAADRVDDEAVRRHRTGWGAWNMETALTVRAKRLELAATALTAPAPGEAQDATITRQEAYQLEGRLRHLLATGGIPCRAAIALAAAFDGAGWSETAVMLASEMTPRGAGKAERLKVERWIASTAHDAVRWAEQTWRHVEPRQVEGPPRLP